MAMDDLGIEKLYIITPGEDRYAYEPKIEVIGLFQFLEEIKDNNWYRKKYERKENLWH